MYAFVDSSILTPIMMFMSFAGAGFFISCLIKKNISGFNDSIFVIPSVMIGMLFFSLVILLLSSLGVYKYEIVYVIKMLFVACAFVGLCINRKEVARLIKLNAGALVFFVSYYLFFLLSTYGNINIHWDARQYNLAFPWLMSMTGKVVNNDTLWHNGTYIPYDILYMMVGDLRNLSNDFSLFDKLKSFESASSFILPLSMYFLSREIGLNKFYSCLSSLSLLSVGSIDDWGNLKNDIFSAGAGLISLTLIIRSYKTSNKYVFFLASVISGWAVSVKLTNAVILAIPFLYLYLCGRFNYKCLLISIALGLLPLFPWMFYSYLGTGSVATPIGLHLPEEVSRWWDIRNSNGLPHGINTAILYFYDIIMANYKISGNQTIGIISLISLVICAVVLLKKMSARQFDINFIVLLSSFLWFFIFYIMRYDNRFLSRYIIASICVMIVFAFEWISRISRENSYVYFFLATVVGVVSINENTELRFHQALNILDFNSLKSSKRAELFNYEKPYRDIELLRKEGDAVAINDHMILLLQPPFYNINSLHAFKLNLYKMNFRDINGYIYNKNIKYILYRKINSWGYENTNQYIEKCTTPLRVYDNGNLKLLKFNFPCG